MTSKAAIRARAARLQAVFEDAGAQPVETDILQPADTLLDLYGEDIRARAFVTYDPVNGEAMLRPDFTVPVVQAHMQNGAKTARYTYSGEVFRRQTDDSPLASETMQVGYEVFGGRDPASSDAEVFALFSQLLDGEGLRAATGDIGILMAAVVGLSTSQRRKAALLRHIWRPNRFRALLGRYGDTRLPASRAALLKDYDPLQGAKPLIGNRGLDEISDRIAALRQDAAEPPILAEEAELLDSILSLKATAPSALIQLQNVAHGSAELQTAVTRMALRLDALDKRGVDVGTLDFEASFGRTSMEYYDGFVFGFFPSGDDDLPAVATGGRYDALTRVLGQGRSMPAVGGVIRPGLMTGGQI